MKQGVRKDDAMMLGAIEAGRRSNMRQLLLRASRIVNRHVVEGLHARGYADLRSTHTTLLSNIDLAGSTVTVAADRAGITKQAMGRLATELERRYARSVGRDRLAAVLRGLAAFVEGAERD